MHELHYQIFFPQILHDNAEIMEEFTSKIQLQYTVFFSCNIKSLRLSGTTLVYGPNKDNPQFYRNLKEKYSEFDNEILIICGDRNFVQNPEVDYFNYLHMNNPHARKVVLDTMEENSLVDVW